MRNIVTLARVVCRSDPPRRAHVWCIPKFGGYWHRYDASASQGVVGANAPLPWLEANLEALLPAGAARCTQASSSFQAALKLELRSTPAFARPRGVHPHVHMRRPSLCSATSSFA